MIFFAGLALVALGLLMLIKPEIFFELTEGWKHSGSNGPSRSYLISTRIGGVFMTAAGLLGMAVPFLT